MKKILLALTLSSLSTLTFADVFCPNEIYCSGTNYTTCVVSNSAWKVDPGATDDKLISGIYQFDYAGGFNKTIFKSSGSCHYVGPNNKWVGLKPTINVTPDVGKGLWHWISADHAMAGCNSPVSGECPFANN